MDNFQSLADYLGTAPAGESAGQPAESQPRLVDITDPKAFSIAVLSSRQFRTYIVDALTLGSIPPAIITRLMDYGWGKPPDRVEHTGKDGQPIEVISEVRRTVVRVSEPKFEDDHAPVVTH